MCLLTSKTLSGSVIPWQYHSFFGSICGKNEEEQNEL